MITQYIIYLKIADEFIQAVNTFKTKNLNFRFINSLYFKLSFRQIREYITNLKVIKIVLFFFNYILYSKYCHILYVEPILSIVVI